ncbi:MAG: peptidase prolyl oligopeptidase active site domain protein [Firmicutes bacterium]|nr:peptidase prolyl oligopeptidase active site domain protein [Bacillota bacterium]
MEKRALSPEDIYRFAYLGDAQISPNGKLVAYVHEYLAKDADKARSEIWVVSAAGGSPRKLTNGPRDQFPRWSPDGAQLAFISDRSSKPQLHLIAVDGGEAARIETKEDVASPAVWSPDGRCIAFLSPIVDELNEGDQEYSGGPPTSAKTKAEAEEHSEAEKKKDNKLGIKVTTTLHHKQDGVGFYGRKSSHICLVGAEATAGKPTVVRQLTRGRFQCDVPSWSPDGKWLATTVTPDLDEPRALWVRHLLLVDAETGATRSILTGEGFPAFAPSFSPDGRYLAFTGEAAPFGWLHDNFDVFVLDISRGAFPYAWSEARNLSAPLDRSVGSAPAEVRHQGMWVMFGPVLWSADSKECLAVFADRGDSHIYAFPVSGDSQRKATGGELRSVAAFSISQSGTIAFGAGNPHMPDEIFALDGSGERQLTAANDALLAEVAVQKVEPFTFKGADNWDVAGWIVYPRGYEAGQRYPTILEIHGGPAGLFGNGFMLSFQMLAAAGYAVVATNPRGSQGYGKEFAWGCVNDWGGKDYQDIQAGVDEVIRRGIADPDRLGVTGWSYGGYMTCWTVTQTRRFKAAIPGACVANLQDMWGTSDIGSSFIEFSVGTTPWENWEKLFERSPIRWMHNCDTPMLLLHGEDDLRCPVTQSEQVYTTLKRLGRTAVMVRYPGEPHGLQRPSHRLDRLERTRHWFDHYVKG